MDLELLLERMHISTANAGKHLRVLPSTHQRVHLILNLFRLWKFDTNVLSQRVGFLGAVLPRRASEVLEVSCVCVCVRLARCGAPPLGVGVSI